MHTGYESAASSSPLQGHDSGRHLEQVIDGLETRLDELARSQRLTRLVILCGSVLLLGMMGLFGLSLYGTLKRQLSPTQVENAVMAWSGTLLGGRALPRVHAAGTDEIRVALVGCGGRGGGATVDALSATTYVHMPLSRRWFPPFSLFSAPHVADDRTPQSIT